MRIQTIIDLTDAFLKLRLLLFFKRNFGLWLSFPRTSICTSPHTHRSPYFVIRVFL